MKSSTRLNMLFRFRWLCLAAFAWSAWETSGLAQQQYQGVCSRVKMVIPQELTIERIGYEATLEVTDNDGNDPITDFSAQLTFEDPKKSGNGVTNDASGLFFVQAPRIETINDINGQGVIAPTTKATIRWFIIPKTGAGGTTPNGTLFRVGCKLAGKIRGEAIPGDVLFAIPATITVRPEPYLEITYFQPRDVQGDDPFTPEVESPIPFPLGVLVKNVGYAAATKLKVDSQQPKIVENKNGLLLVAQLLGTRVNDSPLQTANLLLDLGDIPPGEARKGAWDMITSLSGTFVEFKASYRHASELGGESTSLIKSINAHFIAHEVMNDEPGRDHIKDFLADTDRDVDQLPDTLFESEGNQLPVNYLTSVTVTGGASPGGSLKVDLSADFDGWGYIRVDDPGQSRLAIARVVRSDGKILNTNNYWTNFRYTKIGNNRLNFLNIFDLVELKDYTYTVTYASGGPDVIPPVTTVHFAGQATADGNRTYITPETQVYFLSEDASPVSIVYSLTNSAFLPAIPFSISSPGEYQLVYYATDSAGNREINHTNILVIAGATALGLDQVDVPAVSIYVPGDTLSIRPVEIPIGFKAGASPTKVDAAVDIFAGVAGWASVSGVPSSPTTFRTANLKVGGDYVDFYRYQLDGQAFGGERPVATPITLSGLTDGAHTLRILGRSQYGNYLADSNALAVAWTVDPLAPPPVISGTPATPTHDRTATFHITGTGVTDYKWTLNNSFFRPETNVSAPLLFTSLGDGSQTLAILGKVNGLYPARSNSVSVSWTVDTLWGSDLTSLTRVRSASFTNIGVAKQTFVWDGRSDNGVIQPAGVYTARILIRDQLGHTNFATRLIRIGDLAGDGSVLADANRGPRNSHARGEWVVWEDQSDGTPQIYAQNLIGSGNPIVKVTSGITAQQNPRTDGHYVVWQGRQANGTFDVYIKDLTTSDPATQLTKTPTADEVAPVVEWPWVVFQRKTGLNPAAPWLLQALNLQTSKITPVSPSTQDQLDPDIQGGRVVWQDQRDVGQGEIYFSNLNTGEFLRLTTNVFGQYHPAIFDHWVVWQDNRNGQVDIYGYDLKCGKEVAITQTSENESLPRLDGPWVICEEDSMGPLTQNIRVIHLATSSFVPITRTTTLKAKPSIASGKAFWTETRNGVSEIRSIDLPSLQAVFQNRNTVVVTPAMAAAQPRVFGLLAAWNARAGVTQITHFKSYSPIAEESATMASGSPSGVNFSLSSGDFLWIEFDRNRLLELGQNTSGPLSLTPGANIVSHYAFPSEYTSFRLLRQLGLETAQAVRMLDAEAGRWSMAFVQGGQVLGEDFAIPRVGVLILDLAQGVDNFIPQ